MFLEALQALDSAKVSISEPRSFQDYCLEIGQPNKKTAACISVQSLSGLDKDLHDSNVMVFRLGMAGGTRTTKFALARTVKGWSDYFLIDKEIFDAVDTHAFIPKASYRDLYAFSLIPRFTETSLVNFSLASGLLAEALKLDHAPSIPVTGQSVYTFRFFPRLPEDLSWTHNSGQVEIDSVFTAKRGGRDCLFIVEAKHGSLDSLSKVKLLYPYLALLPHIPKGMPIILVYIRATTTARDLIYNIVECSTPSRSHPSPLDMEPLSPRCFSVTKPRSK